MIILCIQQYIYFIIKINKNIQYLKIKSIRSFTRIFFFRCIIQFFQVDFLDFQVLFIYMKKNLDFSMTASIVLYLFVKILRIFWIAFWSFIRVQNLIFMMIFYHFVYQQNLDFSMTASFVLYLFVKIFWIVFCFFMVQNLIFMIIFYLLVYQQIQIIEDYLVIFKKILVNQKQKQNNYKHLKNLLMSIMAF